VWSCHIIFDFSTALTAIQFRAKPGTILTGRFEEAASLRLTQDSS
jgi:hypothetical protein